MKFAIGSGKKRNGEPIWRGIGPIRQTQSCDSFQPGKKDSITKKGRELVTWELRKRCSLVVYAKVCNSKIQYCPFTVTLFGMTQ